MPSLSSILQSPLKLWARVPSIDKVVFARQLSVLIGAQVPLVSALIFSTN